MFSSISSYSFHERRCRGFFHRALYSEKCELFKDLDVDGPKELIRRKKEKRIDKPSLILRKSVMS